MKPSLVAAGLVAVLSSATACAVAPPTTTAATPSASGTTCTYRVSTKPAKPVDPPSGTGVPNTGTATVVLHFAAGDVAVTVDRAAAPCTAHSFESLATQGFFTNTKCHRMGNAEAPFLQCGDPTGSGTGGPGYTFDDELAKTTGYPKGSIAMANSGPRTNTNGSQFFMMYGDAPFNTDYTVFGTIDDAGVATLAKMAAAGNDKSEPGGFGHPLADTTITSVSVG